MDPYEKSKINTKRYKKVKKILKNVFGHENFRKHQYRIVDSIIREKDVLAVLPTGYGKSLCFQIPPIYTKEIMIVISPLISLMNDQQMLLSKVGIDACCYNSTLKVSEKNKLEKKAQDGGYKIMYITPESFISKSNFIDSIYEKVGICAVAIDEAHCISSYGFDFRVSYRELFKIRSRYPNVPVLCVTATATPKVIKDIQKVMGMEKGVLITSDFDRPNLNIHADILNQNTIDYITEIIKKTEGGSIIYCVTRGDTEKIADILTKNGVETKSYHSGMNSVDRKIIQDGFANGDYNCIAATIAFGMGINKPDVRNVIHYGCPQNIESYYQEIGRAGRDGKESNCYLFYRQKDFIIQKMFIREIKDASYRHTRKKLLNIMSKFVNIHDCRRKYILEYFGNKYDKDNCGHCDNCIKKKSNVRNIKDSQFTLLYKLLSTIEFMENRYGITTISSMLKGSKNKKMTNQMRKCDHFGSFSHLTIRIIKKFIHSAREDGYVELYDIGDCMHVIRSTKIGKKFIQQFEDKCDQQLIDELKINI